MMKNILFSIAILFTTTELASQNFFQDPKFDEPKPPIKTFTKCGGNTGETFDSNSSVYHRIGEGTPDIVVPIKEYCERNVDNSLITSKCLGMIFQYSNIGINKLYKEAVYTELNKVLDSGTRYEISFDVLFNTRLYFDKLDVLPYRTSHFNVVLKNSVSSETDTLIIPVSPNSYKNWSRSSLVFTSKSDYDIVQFDYFSDMFSGVHQNAFIHIFLDNFELVRTEKAETIFKKLEFEDQSSLNTTVLSYYFDSDEALLSDDENERLLKEVRKLNLQHIISIDILAYTDNTNSIDYNLLLSERRSQSVALTIQNQLNDNSIQISSKGKGIDAYKIRDLARRVDVLVNYKEGEIAPWYKTTNNEQYSYNYSYLGNNELARRKDGVPNSKEFEGNQPVRFDNIPFDAEKMIIAKAKKAKVLIINESHTAPGHRVFISKLLPELKQLGYNKLAVEALQEDNQVHSLTFKDPVFLRYLIDARNQGFDLLSYDNKSTIEPDWEKIEKLEGVEYAEGYEDLSKNMNIRDFNQFNQLKAYIEDLNAKEKIIIHVGLGHGGKTQIGDWKPLGSYLIETYGADAILSIDQVTLNDCISLDSNFYYQKYKPLKSIVCSVAKSPYIEKEFNPLSFRFDALYDIQVLHNEIDSKIAVDTSLIYVNHRDLEDADYPLAIMIYENDAHPRSHVAYSAIEVNHREHLKPSIIPNSGDYHILIKDSNNEILVYDTYSQR